MRPGTRRERMLIPATMITRTMAATGLPASRGKPMVSAYHGRLLRMLVSRFGQTWETDAMFAHPPGHAMPRSRSMIALKAPAGATTTATPRVTARHVAIGHLWGRAMVSVPRTIAPT